MFADLTITSEALGVVGGVIATLWASIIFLWRQQVAERDARLNDVISQRDLLLNLLVERGLFNDAWDVLRAFREKKPPA